MTVLEGECALGLLVSCGCPGCEVVIETLGVSGLSNVVGGEGGGDVDSVGDKGASGSRAGWQMVSLRLVLYREMVGSGTYGSLTACNLSTFSCVSVSGGRALALSDL